MELKPCPFCGGKAEKNRGAIGCHSCGAWITAFLVSKAVDLWNTRAPSDIEECCNEYKRELLKNNKELEKRIAELEQFKKWADAQMESDGETIASSRNAALEEAAQLFDNLVKSSNWNPADLEFFAVKIRKLKEE